MQAIQKGALWLTGWLLWIFALTIGLAWITFGFLDLGAVATMAILLLPPIGVSVVVLLWSGRKDRVAVDTGFTGRRASDNAKGSSHEEHGRHGTAGQKSGLDRSHEQELENVG